MSQDLTIAVHFTIPLSNLSKIPSQKTNDIIL